MHPTELTLKPARIYVQPAGPGELTEADLIGAIRDGASIEYRGHVTGKLSAVRADMAVDLVNAINEQDTDFNAQLVRAYANGPAALHKLLATLMRKELRDDVAFFNEREGRVVPTDEVQQ
ncbi:hypothetical protein [Ralstonia syzygii]|uniref:hypothetical protein n=1 Tax=Ralstonia syzygii TaxID=28097 RepID=UPI0035150A0A